MRYWLFCLSPGNTKAGSITVPLTSCLTGLESAVWQLTIFVFICKTDLSKPVKQEVNCTVILPPLVFPAFTVRVWNFWNLKESKILNSVTVKVQNYKIKKIGISFCLLLPNIVKFGQISWTIVKKQQILFNVGKYQNIWLNLTKLTLKFCEIFPQIWSLALL